MCVAAHGRESVDGLPDTSNCYCLPGRAGGSLAYASGHFSASGFSVRAVRFYFLQAATGEDRMVKSWILNIPRWVGVFVALLDKHPALLLTGIGRSDSRLDEREAAAQLRALERDVNFTASELLA